jgi:hypothetical protein
MGENEEIELRKHIRPEVCYVSSVSRCYPGPEQYSLTLLTKNKFIILC